MWKPTAMMNKTITRIQGLACVVALALVLAATGVSCVLTKSLSGTHESTAGTPRWRIKTSVPIDADLRYQKVVGFTDLITLVDPPGVQKNDPRYEAARIPVFPNPFGLKEGDIVATWAWLHVVAEEEDGSYYIQISDRRDSQEHCLIVVVPKAESAGASSAALRSRFAAIRTFIKTELLRGQDPSSHGSVMRRPPFAKVTGQLFYDEAHVGDPPRGKKGCQTAPLWELHPLTDIQFAPR